MTSRTTQQITRFSTKNAVRYVARSFSVFCTDTVPDALGGSVDIHIVVVCLFEILLFFLCVRSFVHSFIHSFISSFVHSFISFCFSLSSISFPSSSFSSSSSSSFSFPFHFFLSSVIR